MPSNLAVAPCVGHPPGVMMSRGLMALADLPVPKREAVKGREPGVDPLQMTVLARNLIIFFYL